jgi:hypothetical protein
LVRCVNPTGTWPRRLEKAMSTAVMNSATYRKLLAGTQLQPIHSEQDYDRTIERIGELTERYSQNLLPEETCLLEMMPVLVGRTQNVEISH